MNDRFHPLCSVFLLSIASLLVSAHAEDTKAINRSAHVLAGIAPAGAGELVQSQVWKAHSAAMQKEWSRYEASTLKPMDAWAAAEVAPYCKDLRVVRYLFSGPDVLHVLRMFPDADTYILGGLEPVGAAPDLDRLSGRSASLAFAEVRKSLEEIIRFSFFKTKDMKVDLANATFSGTLPIMCLFLAHSGHTLADIEFLELRKDGSLKSLGDRHAGADAVKIVTSPRSGRAKTIFYFRTNVADGYIEKSGFLTFLQSQPSGCAYLKAASYLLHNSYFSKVRGHLLDSSRVLVQDDSGIPLRHFAGKRWEVRLHGKYTGPIDLFKGDFQADLLSAFRGSEVKPLPFGTGYRWRKNESNLLVALQNRTLASAVPKAIAVGSAIESPAPISKTVATATGGTPSAGGSAVLRLELLATSTLDSPRSAPSGRALGLFEYRVTGVERGSYSNEKIRVAHGIVWNGRFTSVAAKQAGWITSLELVPISNYPSLKNLPLEDDLATDPSVPVYVPKLD